MSEWLRSNHAEDVAHVHPVDVPDFYEPQAAAVPAEVAIPSPTQQHRGQAPTLLAGHSGQAQRAEGASPRLLVAAAQRKDPETLLRERVEKVIQASVKEFVEAERRRIEEETSKIEVEAENLQVRLTTRRWRLRASFTGEMQVGAQSLLHWRVAGRGSEPPPPARCRSGLVTCMQDGGRGMGLEMPIA